MSDLHRLIEEIGGDQFPQRLIETLWSICRAEHCAILTYDEACPIEIACASLDGSQLARRSTRLYIDRQYWRSDPLLPRALAAARKGEQLLMRIDVSSLPASELRSMLYEQTDCREWLALVGGICSLPVAFAVFRSERNGRFSEEETKSLGDAAATLLAIAAKHAQMLFQGCDLSVALTSLAEIKACLSLSPDHMSAREREVCARILYGMSTTGIALDLGVREQTVITYRKRAYQRLAISSQRELLLWYADLSKRLHSSRGAAHRGSRSQDPAEAGISLSPGRLTPALRILLDLGQYAGGGVAAPRATDMSPPKRVARVN